MLNCYFCNANACANYAIGGKGAERQARKFISFTVRLYYKAKKCSAPSTANNVFKISLQRLPGEGGTLSWEDRDLEYDIFYL